MGKPSEPALRRSNPVLTAMLVLAVVLTIGFILEFFGGQGAAPEDVTDSTTLLFLAAMVKTDGKICPRALSATRFKKETGETIYVLMCSSGHFRITTSEGKETTVELIP
jgi:hypothetical protein